MTNFQILYGLDTDDDGSVDRYKPMNLITTAEERKKIVAVSLKITLEEKIGADTLKKTFSSAVYLRNRV